MLIVIQWKFCEYSLLKKVGMNLLEGENCI